MPAKKTKKAKKSVSYKFNSADIPVIVTLVLIFIHLLFGSLWVKLAGLKLELFNLRLLILLCGATLFFRYVLRAGKSMNRWRTISEFRYEIILVIFVAIFMIPRFMGIGYGLPHLFDYDESTIVGHTLKMIESGSLNPGFFIYGAIYFYLMFASFSGYFLMVFAKSIPFSAFSTVPASDFYLAARGVNTVLSALTLILVFIVGKRYFNKKVGLAASIALGCSLSHYIISTTVRPDMLVLVFFLSAFIFIHRVTQSGKTPDYIWSAVFIALAMGTKYYGMFMIPSLIYAHYLFSADKPKKKRNYRILIIALVLVPLIFIATNPFIILDFKTFMRDSSIMVRLINGLDTHWSSAAATPGQRYTQLLFYYSFGYIGGILALMALAFFLFRPNREDGLLLMFPFVHFFVLIGSRQVHHRFFLLLLPFLMLFTFKFIYRLLARFYKDRKLALIFWLALIIIVAYPAYQVARTTQMYRTPTTSDATYEWIRENIPKGSRLICKNYTVQPEKIDYSYKKFGRPQRLRLRNMVKPGTGFHYLVTKKIGTSHKLHRRMLEGVTLLKEIASRKGEVTGKGIMIFRINPAFSYDLKQKGEPFFTHGRVDAAVDIGLKEEDAMYLNSSWGPAKNDKIGRYRTIGAVPAQFYFKIAENVKQRSGLNMRFFAGTDNRKAALKISLNGKDVKTVILVPSVEPVEYGLRISAADLKTGQKDINFIEFTTLFGSGKESIYKKEVGLLKPRVRFHNITFSLEQ